MKNSFITASANINDMDEDAKKYLADFGSVRDALNSIHKRTK